jgi:Glycosyl hydrolases family 43
MPDAELPYGATLDDPALALTPHNSQVLALELRPQDQALGRVWMRDTYVNCFKVGGVVRYYCTGSTRVPGLTRAAPWNDGIYLWQAPQLQGPWTLVDTTALRPGQPKGRVWSQEMTQENRPGHVVVAPWQQYVEADGMQPRRGQVWAPELHFIRGTWCIVACMGDHARLVGSFILVSDGGPEGPYRNIAGNVAKPLGDAKPGRPTVYPIDGSLFVDGDTPYLVLHNHFYARLADDLSDIEPSADLPRFVQTCYEPEPYLEGAYVFKHGGRYHLMHAAWSYHTAGSEQLSYLEVSGGSKHHYNTVVASAERFEGPYGPRYTSGVGIGHNNFFTDADGALWATFFKNPNHGVWSDPAHADEMAVAGIVRIQATGQRLVVQP